LPKAYWCYAVNHVVHIINRLPTTVLSNVCPYQILYKRPPTYLNLKVFGTMCFASTLECNRAKLDPRARKCVFLGFKTGIKGYVLLDTLSREIFISRNVIFYENIFPYKAVNQHIQSTDSKDHDLNFLFDDIDNYPKDTRVDNQTLPRTDTADSETESIPDTTSDDSTSHYDINLPHNNDQEYENVVLRRSERQRKPPTYLKDYLHQVNNSMNPKHFIHNKFVHKANYPITSVLSYKSLSKEHLKYTLAITSTHEPHTYTEACQDVKWIDVIHKEIKALEDNKTWYFTDLPKGKKPIGCKWIFKIKYKSDGTIERHKARLVAKGYTQLEGIDYIDTFSPVAKLTIMRLLLAIAATKNWYLHQLDVDNAFLHGNLDEEVYMNPPPGLQVPKPRQVCRLTKSLYGLKQASCQWFARLSSFLISAGFSQSQSDHSLFTKVKSDTFTVLLVYVDDVILAGNSLNEIDKIKASLHEAFRIKDLGSLKYFLGFEVARSTKGIYLCQRKYALDILSETGMLDCKPCQTPLMNNTKDLFDKAADPINDPESYRRLIGKLLYLTNSRPDICYSVHLLSQFVQAPTIHHQQAAQHILRYLKTSPANGLFFAATNDMQIKAFSDSDWATCPDTRRSVTGYCVFLGNSLISWKSKKQSTVSRSSSEAEYRALATTTCEVQWLSYLLHDFHVQHTDQAVLYCDSQSARQIAHNPTFHERTKHIDLDCHVVREKLQKKLFHLLLIRFDDQLTDIFTKALHRTFFKTILPKLGLMDIHHPT